MSYGIYLQTIPQKMFNISIFDMSLKITNLSLQLYLPGTNELT